MNEPTPPRWPNAPHRRPAAFRDILPPVPELIPTDTERYLRQIRDAVTTIAVIVVLAALAMIIGVAIVVHTLNSVQNPASPPGGSSPGIGMGR